MKIKELLDFYRFWTVQVRKKQREIRRLEETKTSITLNNDGLPRGTARYTMEDYLAAKEDLEKELKELRREQLRYYDDIFKLLVRLDNVREIDILFRRYLNLESWKHIREMTGLSRSYAFAIHERALEKIEKIYLQDQRSTL